MVEGGATIINSFLRYANKPHLERDPLVFDTIIITTAPTLVGDDGTGYKVGFSNEQLVSVCSAFYVSITH